MLEYVDFTNPTRSKERRCSCRSGHAYCPGSEAERCLLVGRRRPLFFADRMLLKHHVEVGTYVSRGIAFLSFSLAYQLVVLGDVVFNSGADAAVGSLTGSDKYDERALGEKMKLVSVLIRQF